VHSSPRNLDISINLYVYLTFFSDILFSVGSGEGGIVSTHLHQTLISSSLQIEEKTEKDVFTPLFLA